MKIVIFGDTKLSSLAWYVMTNDSPHDVAGFTADSAYCTTDSFHGLPMVPFETLEDNFPPDEAALLIPLGARNINGLRASRYLEAKKRGYRFASYVSSRATAWEDLVHGENCMIYDGAIIQPFATMGSNCIIRSGAFVSHHVDIGDHCFVAAMAAIGGGVSLGERCFLGLNCTIRDGITIAPRCFVAAGAVVTQSTTENGVYVGVPARRRDVPAELVKW